jgi:tripartite-type tricarboxylate transporter receptor subunit TctC
MSSSRSAQLPDVPTLAEAGVANSETFEWNGMFVPTGVPPAITAKLSDALKKALDSPDFKDQIAKVGGELFVGGNAEAVNFIQLQFDRMGKVIREGNIRPE